MEVRKVELYHHGILGQKWGVRNGPPYPLGVGKHSEREKKVGWRRSLSKAKSEQPQNDKSSLRKGVKAILVRRGTQLTAACLWAIGEYPLNNLTDLKRIGEYAVRRKSAPRDGYDSKTGFKLKKAQSSILEDVQALNPSSNMNNCTVCSMAYDLRRRGFDVSAAPANKFGLTLSDISKCYEHVNWNYFSPVKSSHQDTFDQLKSQLSRMGNGSRGILTGKYLSGGGHAICWEIKNGQPIFIDGQVSKIFTDPYNELFSRFNELTISYARLDNLELNVNRLSGFIQDS